MDLKCLGQMVCCGATSGKLSTNVATKAWVLPFPGRRSNDIALVRLQQGTVEELGSTGLATHASRTCLFSLPCFKVNFFFLWGFVPAHVEKDVPQSCFCSHVEQF
jgi:hypothetical protein